MTPPAAVVEAIGTYLCRSISNLDETHADEVIAPGLIAAAAEAGWVLVSKGLIEEAVNGLTRHSSVDNAFDVASRLRSALGNGGSP